MDKEIKTKDEELKELTFSAVQASERDLVDSISSTPLTGKALPPATAIPVYTVAA